MVVCLEKYLNSSLSTHFAFASYVWLTDNLEFRVVIHAWRIVC